MAGKLNFKQDDGQTPLEDASGLKIKVTNQEELNKAEFENFRKANAKYLLARVTPQLAPFTTGWLKDVHIEMLGDVWEWAGEIRRTGKTIGVPPYKIAAEIHQLLSELSKWEKEKVPPADTAVRLHHRLVHIHPFENGNGRWARLVTNIYLRKNGKKFINWPADMTEIKNTFRPQYIQALKAGDHGDLAALARLHAQYSGEDR